MIFTHAIPIGWDMDWIYARASQTLQYTFTSSDPANPGYGKLTYEGEQDQFDAVEAAVDAYEVEYANEVMRPAMLADAAAERYAAQQRTVIEGKIILCDDSTAGRISLAISKMSENGSRNWKMGDGSWDDVTRTDLEAMALVIDTHRQACFDHEKSLADLINAAPDAASLSSIDVTAGWPE